MKKAWLVRKTFADGEFEGVIFTRKSDAIDAFSGYCGSGAALAVEWCDMYGGDEGVTMIEIEIPND